MTTRTGRGERTAKIVVWVTEGHKEALRDLAERDNRSLATYCFLKMVEGVEAKVVKVRAKARGEGEDVGLAPVAGWDGQGVHPRLRHKNLKGLVKSNPDNEQYRANLAGLEAQYPDLNGERA